MQLEDYELCAMPWFPLYCGDLLKDTMHLNATEFGVYSLFLVIVYSTGRPLPDNEDQLRTMARVSEKEWPHIRRAVLEYYFALTPQGWFKKKIGEVMTAQVKASRKGKKGAAMRWGGEGNPAGIAQAHAQTMPKGCYPHPEPQPNSTPSLSRAPVEPLPNFPKTEAQAVQHAMQSGAPEEFIKRIWNKAMGRGGNDSRDIPIRNWANHVATEWAYEQDRRARNATNQRTGQQRPDRNAGTANEGNHTKYKGLGKVAQA